MNRAADEHPSTVAAQIGSGVLFTGCSREPGNEWVAVLADAISKEKGFGNEPGSTTVGAEGGVDLLKLGLDRLGVFARIESLFISDGPYQELSFGFAYRR